MCGDEGEGEQGMSRSLVMTRGWRGQPQRGRRAGEGDVQGLVSSPDLSLCLHPHC